MEKGKFFALVGPTGAGKSELLERLGGILPDEQFVFLCDSSGCGSEHAPHAKFITSVTQIAKEGIHSCTTPRSQLLVFWSRLATIIECVVVPNLNAGKSVIMNGFGGTILAHALSGVKNISEEEALIDLHKSLIAHCVTGLGIQPPTYLLLRPSPEVAYARRASHGNLSMSEALEFITTMNARFDFYSRLPGQTVRPIDADQSPDEVLISALSIIAPNYNEVSSLVA